MMGAQSTPGRKGRGRAEEGELFYVGLGKKDGKSRKSTLKEEPGK